MDDEPEAGPYATFMRWVVRWAKSVPMTMRYVCRSLLLLNRSLYAVGQVCPDDDEVRVQVSFVA